MTTAVTAADAAQFLSFVPHLLGFTPTRSIVLVPMQGTRTLGAMRVDIPKDDPAALDGFAATVTGMICRVSEVDGFVAAIYTDESAALDLPHHRVVQALDFAAEASGLRFVDALVVAADGWGSHFDSRVPPGGRPLAELIPVPASAFGSVHPDPTGDQSSGAELPAATPAQRRQVVSALRSLRTALEVLCGIPCDVERATRIDPAALEAACEIDDAPRLFETALREDAGDLAPMRVALLTWCLSRPSLRDIALVQWATDIVGGEDAADAQRRWEDGEEYPADLASIMWGEGKRPDPARLMTALTLVRAVAARTPKKDRAGALSVCAWLSWALGRSTHAEAYARQARRIDPEHGLAEIVASFVAAGHLPDWAFRRGGPGAGGPARAVKR